VADATYDIITIGGGLAGASLAKAMAERGARVLVLERETKFRDRVRGEGMPPWGVADAQELGVRELLLSHCGHEHLWWDVYMGPMLVQHRNIVETTPGGVATLTFYHPEMQETLIAAAESAGAEVRRGVKATSVSPGSPASVTVEHNGSSEEIPARLVVGADGRNSVVRKWGGFASTDDAPRLRIAGVFFENMDAPADDTTRLVVNPTIGRGAILFPQGGGRVRAYVVHWVHEQLGLQGEEKVPSFVAAAVETGIPAELYTGAKAAGPLATFDGADSFVEQPYRAGVALIGDAASTSDPSWGQGLALTMHDVRLLRDALTANDDWDAAGRAYASAHDRDFGKVHAVEDWFTQLFFEMGPEADARRAKAIPLQLQEAERTPDVLFSGPAASAADETARRRFFGEE
jgi:2-polyprenyl-6-methoxyphenol hydroxylase-like FAD-dependent oxidoreductase